MMTENKTWFQKYSDGTYCSKFLTGAGSHVNFKTASLNLPKTISRIWTVKQVSELPSVKINNKLQDEMFEQDLLKDIAVPVNKLLALGTIFVIPTLNQKLGITYDVIVEDDSIIELDYFIEDDELLYLTYARTEKIMLDGKPQETKVVYRHYIQDNVYYFEQYFEKDNNKIYLNDHDGSKPISNDRMLPFKIDLRINADSIAMPIWANASTLIDDCNKTYHEMMNEMELQRSIVGIPQSLVSQSDRTNKDVLTMSEYHRVFAIIPGLDGEMNDWKYFGGNFDPKPYIETLNMQLCDVSIQCGFDRKYLAYTSDGGAKTAKEVIFSKHDTFVNQNMINQTMETLLKRLFISCYYLKFGEFPKDEIIEIEFEDSVFNSRDEYMQQLEVDYMNGAITREFYLRERYPQENIDEIINHDVISEI